MRRPNRNIEIFSLSVLDLFSAAMGAFIIVAVILFPHYMKTSESLKEQQEAKQKVSQCQNKVASLQDQVKEEQQRSAACRQAASSTFLAITMEWQNPGYDVDLYVIDPHDKIFYYEKNNRKPFDGGERPDFPQSSAELTYDNRDAGVEMWQDSNAALGRYCVAFVLYSSDQQKLGSDARVYVRGRVFYRNGSEDLPPITLTFDSIETRYKAIGAVVLGPEGDLQLNLEDAHCTAAQTWGFKLSNAAKE